MTDDLTKKVAKAIKDNTEKLNQSEQAMEITINGDGNIVGDGNVVVKTEKIVHKHRVFVTPGVGVINSQQAAVLYKLVHEIAHLEEIARKTPRQFGEIWRAVNTLCGVTSYKEIPLEKYDKAENYLRQWIGRLSSTKTAKKHDAGWRNRKLSFIHININKLKNNDKLRKLLKDKYGVASLTELSDDDLVDVYFTVASWKQTAKEKQK